MSYNRYAQDRVSEHVLIEEGLGLVLPLHPQRLHQVSEHVLIEEGLGQLLYPS